MTESANLFREVKLVTRSLLLSAPRGLSVKNFINDYRVHNGQSFPFKELGYSSAIDLIRDLPDAVHMEWSSSIGDYWLKGIADDSTKHIENLVKKQKKGRSSYPQPPRFQRLHENPSHGRRTLNQPAMKRITNHHMSGLVPAKLRSQIRQLLASYEDGLLISNFRIAFKKQFGTDFPFATLGFSSLENCLRHIPDIALLRYSDNLLKVYPVKKKDNEGRSTNTSAMKSEKLVGTVEQPKKNRASSFENKNISQNHMDSLDGFDSLEHSKPVYTWHQQNIVSRSQCSPLDNTFTVKSECDKFDDTFTSVVQDNKDVMSKVQHNNSEDTFSSKTQHSSINDHTFSLSTTRHKASDFFNLKDECDGQDDDVAPVTSHNITNDDSIPEKIKRDFQRVLEFHSEGIWATEFIDKYTAITRQKLDINELGYYSLIELVSALPDIFVIHRPDDCKDDWLLFDASNPNVKKVEPNKSKAAATVSLNSSTCEEEPEINEALKSKILSILKYCCSDIALEEFEKMYKANFGTELPWESLGFDSVEAFMVVLSGDVPLSLKNINGKFYVTLQSDSLRSQTSNMFVDLKPQPVSIPNDSALSDMHFQTQALPEDISKYIGIYVSTVDHPGQIWIQIRGETTTVALEVLMENLEKVYYGNEGDNYRMPGNFVEVGQVCAVVWPGDENWHRAVITGIPSKECVEVFYVDYGSKCNVKKSSLRLLRKDFLSLPAQALKARLAHILPAVGKRWSERSKQMLLDLCTDRPLAALITNTEYEGRLSICLCDVSGDNDFHINDFLIREGFAKPAKDPYSIDNTEEVANEMDKRLTTSPLLNQTHQQPNDVNSVALALANYQNLTGMVNIAAARLIAQLSGSGMNVDSLPQLLTSLTLGAASDRNKCSENVFSSVPNSVVQSEEGILEEPREIFEEGDEFFEQLCQSAEELKFSIKRVSLVGGQVIHIINSNNKPFVSSGDISSLFGKCVCLEKLLMMKKILIPSITLEKPDNEELFHELKRYEVKGIKNEKGTTRVILYPLQSVIEILDDLSHPSEILRKEIIDVITEVNNCEDFWQDTAAAQDPYLTTQNVEKMSIQELTVMYEDHCKRRNKLIQKMTEPTGPKDYHVEELHYIESNLLKLNARIKELENSRKNEMNGENRIFQAIRELPKTDFSEHSSGECNNHHSLSYTATSVSPKEMHSDLNTTLERSKISPSVKQEEPSNDFQLFGNDNITTLPHSEVSSVQYSCNDSKQNGTANGILSQFSNTCTEQIAAIPAETACEHIPVTQGKISFIVPSKPLVRFSSQIYAPRFCFPASPRFSVRPTVVQPRYTLGTGTPTS